MVLQAICAGIQAIPKIARPSDTPNQPARPSLDGGFTSGQKVQSVLPYTEYSPNVDNDTYRFKTNNVSPSNIWYQGIWDRQPGSYELPLVTERGSHWTSVSIADAQLQYSREIAQAQWTINGIDGSPISSVRDIGALSPAMMQIQNFPNPFTAATGTRFSYTLPKDSHVQVKVFDLFGREVAAITNEREAAGKHEIGFKPESNLPAGSYICRLEVDGQPSAAKTILLTK